jgi:hypothetical protein
MGERLLRVAHFPLQNVVIAGGSSGSLHIIELDSKYQFYRQQIHSEGVKGIFMTNDDIIWPNVITVGMEGRVVMHMFDAPKVPSDSVMIVAMPGHHTVCVLARVVALE